MDDQISETDHYGDAVLAERVKQALQAAGLDKPDLDWSELAPLDQFHLLGLAATRELAAGLDIETGAAVLDVGCGLGGPARYLAATYGCRLTGIDLSQSFVDVARMLTERVGLSSRVVFRRADALDLPFADEEFDRVWILHVAMNIADRERLYRNIHRVLRPGGRLAMYDVVAGDGWPLLFPVPWARQQAQSFLLTSAETRRAVEEAGFAVESWVDQTDAVLAWFAEQQAARPSEPAPSPLGLHVVMGTEFAVMIANLGRNFREGKTRLLQGVVKRV